MRVAAIDIGTNSVLLLVAEARGGALEPLAPLVERAEITRLGQGVDKTRKLAPEAAERTLACLERYAAEIRALGVSRVAAVGTSAMRDAEGGAEFAARAAGVLGVRPRVIPGALEAELTFEGALAGLRLGQQEGEGEIRALVFDVGGGSTELILGRLGPEGSAGKACLEAAASLDVGSVRLTERHVRSDPPAELELEAARADVRRALASLPFALPPPAERTALRVIGVAGTVTTLAALALGVVPYDASVVHGARLSEATVQNLLARLASLPLAERQRLPGLEPKRADVIVAGAALVLEVLAFAATHPSAAPDLIVSDRGVRWGLAARLAALDALPPELASDLDDLAARALGA